MHQTQYQVLDNLIQGGQGRVTIPEAAAATGLAMDDVKDGLMHCWKNISAVSW